MQNIWNFIVKQLSLQENGQTLAIIQVISDSNLETGRYGSKSGVSWIIRESWKHSLWFWRYWEQWERAVRQGSQISFSRGWDIIYKEMKRKFSYPEKTADIILEHHLWFPYEMTSEEWVMQKSQVMNCHY